MKLKDPKKPTRDYIKSVLESEGLVPNAEAIQQCFSGWRDAVNDKNPIETAQKLEKAFKGGDLWSIGYCTYANGYALQSTTQPNKRTNPTINRVVLPATYRQQSLF